MFSKEDRVPIWTLPIDTLECNSKGGLIMAALSLHLPNHGSIVSDHSVTSEVNLSTLGQTKTHPSTHALKRLTLRAIVASFFSHLKLPSPAS